MQLIKYIRSQEKPRESKLDMHMILLRDRTEEGDIKMNLAKLSPASVCLTMSFLCTLSLFFNTVRAAKDTEREAVPSPPPSTSLNANEVVGRKEPVGMTGDQGTLFVSF